MSLNISTCESQSHAEDEELLFLSRGTWKHSCKFPSGLNFPTLPSLCVSVSPIGGVGGGGGGEGGVEGVGEGAAIPPLIESSCIPALHKKNSDISPLWIPATHTVHLK